MLFAAVRPSATGRWATHGLGFQVRLTRRQLDVQDPRPPESSARPGLCRGPRRDCARKMFDITWRLGCSSGGHNSQTRVQRQGHSTDPRGRGGPPCCRRGRSCRCRRQNRRRLARLLGGVPCARLYAPSQARLRPAPKRSRPGEAPTLRAARRCRRRFGSAEWRRLGPPERVPASTDGPGGPGGHRMRLPRAEEMMARAISTVRAASREQPSVGFSSTCAPGAADGDGDDNDNENDGSPSLPPYLPPSLSRQRPGCAGLVRGGAAPDPRDAPPGPGSRGC